MDELNLQAAGGNLLTLGSLDNPNKMPFKGVLTYLGVPSDNPPGGSGGLKVMIPVDVGQSALDSLKGMPVNLAASLDAHDTDAIVGIIEESFLGEETDKGVPVYISGHIFAKSFPDEARVIKASQSLLGFSYETARTKLGMGIYHGETVAVAQSLVFTGAAILYKDSAAYESTSLAAKKDTSEKDTSEGEVNELKDETNKEVIEETLEAEATENAENVDQKSEESAEEVQAAADEEKPADKKTDEETEEETTEEDEKPEDKKEGR
ncbi:hypothetical protein [Paenibacillus hexagrammi]|uniref:Uncharacterized protein n=1 Tax=Paenibacillus hexagrammi TaxID=2908839 RepID=A0ABY3SUB1_9BACL|nr:hypothetical protein [Paenibacillus sp. YPD9-1]UJF36537.1 hypothetical protein L0M14_30585 [Paenibacillus sp. YPD9-1]